MQNEPEHSLFGLTIDGEAESSLRVASKWARVLAVLGFIIAALVLLTGIIVFVRLTGSFAGVRGNVNYARPRAAGSGALTFLVLYAIVAGIFTTGSVFTLSFSRKIGDAMRGVDQSSLNEGFSSLKNLVIFWTVISLFLLVLLLLAFIGVALI